MAVEKNDNVKLVEDALRISYEYCMPKFRDAWYCYENYKNKIDKRIWGTISECPIPMAYATVEGMMPTIMDYLFGTPKPFALIPLDGSDDPNLDKVERYMYGKIFHEFDLKRKLKPVLRDAIILPCSYVLVEDTFITPPNVGAIAIMQPDGSFAYHVQMQPGEKKRSVNIRQVDFFSVFPSVYGRDTTDCDYVVIVDFIPEDEIATAIEEGVLSGSLERMKQEAKDLNSYADSALFYARKVVDPDSPKLGTDVNIENSNSNLPFRIPVIKYMGRDKHIWISGSQVIYKNDSREVMSSNLVRFCAQQIGLDWFPQSISQFSMDMYNLLNAWYNSVVDILSHHLYPVTIVNKSMLNDQEQDISYQPNLVIETTGNPQAAIHYPQMPPIPPAMLQFPQEIRSLLQSINGMSEMLTGSGGVGMVRGGNNALQSLLARASARVVAIAEELELSGMKPLYEKLLLKLQLMGDANVSYIDNNNMRVTETITAEEIKRAIGVQVLGKKRMENKFADQMVKIQAIPIMLQSGFDPLRVMRWVFPDSDVDQLVSNMPITTPQAVVNGNVEGGIPNEELAQTGGLQE